MADRYWFKPKVYGYGATPSTWEGWAFSAGHLALVLLCVFLMVWYQENYSLFAAAMTVVVLSTAVAVWIAWKKTEGGWAWRWGKK